MNPILSSQIVFTFDVFTELFCMPNKNFLILDNIMDLTNDQFFEFVKQSSGEKVAILLQFQDISNVDCLLACIDPFEILSYDSNDLLDLKRTTCVQLNNSSFVVLPGVKSEMNLLKNALRKKCNQLKNDAPKTSSHIIITNNSSTTIMATNNTDNSTDKFPVITTDTSLSSNLKPEEKIKQYLVNSLNAWCQKTKDGQNGNKQLFYLKENID